MRVLGRYGRAVVHPAVETESFFLRRHDAVTAIEIDCPRNPLPQVQQQSQAQTHLAPPAPPLLWVSVHVFPLFQAFLLPSRWKGVGGPRETIGEAEVSKWGNAEAGTELSRCPTLQHYSPRSRVCACPTRPPLRLIQLEGIR